MLLLLLLPLLLLQLPRLRLRLRLRLRHTLVAQGHLRLSSERRPRLLGHALPAPVVRLLRQRS
jgi:hypothetical protein